MAKTLYDKLFDDHLVSEQEDGTCLLYIDRHLVHEVTSPQAFEGLRMNNRKVKHPEYTLAKVYSGCFTFLLFILSPSNACGLVTSWTKCLSIYSKHVPSSCSETKWSSNNLSYNVFAIIKLLLF